MSTRQARVTVAYATVKLLDPASGKWTVIGFPQGAVFPSNADPANVAALVRREYAEWVEEAPAEQPPADPEPEPDPATEPEPGKDAPPANPAPPQAAAKADWVAYAVTQRAEGVSEADAQAEAEAKTKAELIDEFGG